MFSAFSQSIAFAACISIVFIIMGGDPAAAQNQFVEIIPTKDAQEEEIELLRQHGDTVEQLLIGAIGVLDQKAFPAIVRLKGDGHHKCTAALVGPQAVLTAAHCLGNKKYTFSIGGDTKSARCWRSKYYSKTIELENDWALCELSTPAKNITFETMDVETRPVPKEVLMLTGYGCTVESGSTDGKLRYGYAAGLQKPDNWSFEAAAIYTQSSITNPNTTASLCAGDSGGPVFRTGADGPSDQRRIVGVNSRTIYSSGISVFSATASVTGIGFFEGWVDFRVQPICGVPFNGSPYDEDCI